MICQMPLKNVWYLQWYMLELSMKFDFLFSFAASMFHHVIGYSYENVCHLFVHYLGSRILFELRVKLSGCGVSRVSFEENLAADSNLTFRCFV